jgi:hypothetical protein
MPKFRGSSSLKCNRSIDITLVRKFTIFKLAMSMDFVFSKRCIRFGSIRLTGWTIWVLEKIYGSALLNVKLTHLRTLEPGTVGREIAEMLDSKNYRLIPKFENHDLKHIILDYDMTMKDEIRMQAYLVGNGNFTLPCLIFLALGLFYPSIWKDLPGEFNCGRRANSIYFLTLDNCMDMTLMEVKELYGRNSGLSDNTHQ